MNKKRDTVVICFANNKGGSGKSTACANAGYELSLLGKNVLLIDGDMQLNLTLSFFEEAKVLELAQNKRNLYYAIQEQKELSEYIVPTPYQNLDLIPSSTMMSQIELTLFSKKRREFILNECLKQIKASRKYDYILIDAPPTLGAWVTNILCASDEIIVPVEASPWGLFGLANMFDFIDTIGKMTAIRICGVLISKVDERKNYYRQTKMVLATFEDIHVFKTVIHVDSAIEWAQDASKPVAVFKKTARSAREFNEFAKEIKENVSR